VTGEQVWIATATLQDIKLAQKKKRPPWPLSRRYLVMVPSPQQRLAVYEMAAAALQELEERVLPTYGGRKWKCVVTIKEQGTTSASPYFCWHTKRGRLELAAWPHIVEKMPDPPRFPGYYAGGGGGKQRKERKTATAATTSNVALSDDTNAQVPDEDDAVDEVVSSDDEEDDQEVLSDELLDLRDLQEREPSGLSELAWSERWRVPLPTIQYKWISPLRQSFTSRKSAWEHAVQLCKQEVLLDKVLTGYGANGKPLKVTPPTRKTVMTAGKMRFERDGLWVVGQEEAWGLERYKRRTPLLQLLLLRVKIYRWSRQPLA
jgi:hypothetical protein